MKNYQGTTKAIHHNSMEEIFAWKMFQLSTHAFQVNNHRHGNIVSLIKASSGCH